MNAPEVRAEAAPAQVQTGEVGLTRLLVLITLAAAGLGACFNGIQQVLVPGQVEMMAPGTKVASLAILTTFAAVCSLVGIPLGGALSDRTRSHYGRRAPWVIALAVVSAPLLLAMGASAQIVVMGVVYSLAWLTLNMHQGALTAVLPDRIPEDRRGFASAIIGLGTPVGAMIGMNIASHVGGVAAYAILAVLLVASSAVFVFGAREPSSLGLVLPVQAVKEKRSAASFFEAFRHRDFTLAFISRFMLFLSYFTVSGYLFYTLSDYIGIDQVPDRNIPVAVSTLISISVVAWVTIAAFCGWLADKLDRRKLFVGISAVGLGATMFVPIISPTWNGMIVYSVLVGIFIGVYFAVDLAIMSLVLPYKESSGRDFGILAVATGLPQIMSSVIAGGLITYAGGYTALYLFGAACAIVSGVVVLFIRKVR